MDNSGDGVPTGTPGAATWGPDHRLWIVALVCTVAAALWAAFDRNAENRLVASVLAVVFALITVTVLRIRVRLRADAAGIEITGMTSTRRIAWADVAGISAPRRGRFGRRGASLELEIARDGADGGSSSPSDTDLLVFGSFDLGTDPAVVGRALQRLRPLGM